MTTPPPPASPPTAPAKRRPPLWLLAGGALLILALILYVPGLFFVETDDAAIAADTVTITPKVAAYVTVLHVTDNSAFKKGDLLVELDPRDFITARDNAKAALDGALALRNAAEAQIAAQRETIEANMTKLEGDAANLTYAQQELSRFGKLAQNGAGTREEWQKAQADETVREATLTGDKANLAAARAQAAVLTASAQQALASVAAAQAALAQAELNLGYTRISAPVTGTVANRTVNQGDYVQPGQSLFSAVPDSLYVIANFKETQLARLRPGLPVTITVGAMPGLVLHGHLDSFQRGTGSYFALLPPENATGNFVKIIQRVPVKILLNGPLPAGLGPGMSVEARVRIRQLPAF